MTKSIYSLILILTFTVIPNLTTYAQEAEEVDTHFLDLLYLYGSSTEEVARFLGEPQEEELKDNGYLEYKYPDFILFFMDDILSTIWLPKDEDLQKCTYPYDLFPNFSVNGSWFGERLSIEIVNGFIGTCDTVETLALFTDEWIDSYFYYWLNKELVVQVIDNIIVSVTIRSQEAADLIANNQQYPTTAKSLIYLLGGGQGEKEISILKKLLGDPEYIQEGEASNDLYYQSKGFAFQHNNEYQTLETVSLFHNVENIATYSHPLPFGLQIDMSGASVLELLGPPERESGGNGLNYLVYDSKGVIIAVLEVLDLVYFIQFGTGAKQAVFDEH